MAVSISAPAANDQVPPAFLVCGTTDGATVRCQLTGVGFSQAITGITPAGGAWTCQFGGVPVGTGYTLKATAKTSGGAAAGAHTVSPVEVKVGAAATACAGTPTGTIEIGGPGDGGGNLVADATE